MKLPNLGSKIIVLSLLLSNFATAGTASLQSGEPSKLKSAVCTDLHTQGKLIEMDNSVVKQKKITDDYILEVQVGDGGGQLDALRYAMAFKITARTGPKVAFNDHLIIKFADTYESARGVDGLPPAPLQKLEGWYNSYLITNEFGIDNPMLIDRLVPNANQITGKDFVNGNAHIEVWNPDHRFDGDESAKIDFTVPNINHKEFVAHFETDELPNSIDVKCVVEWNRK